MYQLIAPKQPKALLIDSGKPNHDDDANTASTGLSTLTPRSTLLSGGGRSTTSRSGTFIKNPNVDTSLQGLLPSGVKINDLVGSDAAPMGDDNTPYCLSYHIRGGCFSNCHRKDNHTKALSQADKQKLSNWIVDQTAKLKARFNSG
jgi:hypothetical protein